MIKIIFEGQEQVVRPTIFPDKTSQVWKLHFFDKYIDQKVKIVWLFEEEAEVMWINQLISLLYHSHVEIEELYIPYLPYGRQDKHISNTTTFAREVFLSTLAKEFVKRVTTLDIHSPHYKIESYPPTAFIKEALFRSGAEVIVYPDSGAYNRYSYLLPNKDYIVLDKERDQLTGNIKGLTFNKSLTTYKGEGSSFLIVDDICDGGATFCSAALFLHENYKCEVSLYVTHGLYTKGFDKMIASGICRFYTTQSNPQNIAGFPLTY